MPLTFFNQNIDTSGKEDEVQKYYDHNTTLFLKHGEHGKTHGIHQPIYFNAEDGIKTAMHSQHALILGRMQPEKSLYKVLDLGCGVGSSIRHLHGLTSENVEFTGVSISPEQIEFAQNSMKSSGNGGRIAYVCASFQQLPGDFLDYDLAFAIESFIHSPDPKVFFQQVSNCLKPGGLLIIFDDFLHGTVISKNDKRVLHEFHTGWKANNLHPIKYLNSAAQSADLEIQEDMDLTPYLKLGRFRDKMIAAAAPVLRVLPFRNQYTTFLIGGNARQQGFKRGLLGYRMLVFRKL